jgi:tRNA nucleotidyltransferase/poly(A) polymerase
MIDGPKIAADYRSQHRQLLDDAHAEGWSLNLDAAINDAAAMVAQYQYLQRFGQLLPPHGKHPNIHIGFDGPRIDITDDDIRKFKAAARSRKAQKPIGGKLREGLSR